MASRAVCSCVRHALICNNERFACLAIEGGRCVATENHLFNVKLESVGGLEDNNREHTVAVFEKLSRCDAAVKVDVRVGVVGLVTNAVLRPGLLGDGAVPSGDE